MKNYTKKDATREPIQWTGLSTIMLGILKDGTTYRMDGTRVSVSKYSPADADKLETFALTGQWEFPLP